MNLEDPEHGIVCVRARVCVYCFHGLQSFTNTPFIIDKAPVWISATTERVVWYTSGTDGDKGQQGWDTVGYLILTPALPRLLIPDDPGQKAVVPTPSIKEMAAVLAVQGKNEVRFCQSAIHK